MCPPGFTGTRCEQGKEEGAPGPGQERMPGWEKTLKPRGWTWRVSMFQEVLNADTQQRLLYPHALFLACREGRFGQSCQEQCPGTSGCRGLTFCLPDPYGCSCGSGWRGSQCQEGTD